MHLHIILVMTYLASFTPGLFYGVVTSVTYAYSR